MRFLQTCAIIALLVCGTVQAVPAQSGAQPPKQQDEFVPIDQLPPEEQMPAAPMVVAAYAFIWIAFLAYVFTLIGRMKKLERDLQRLEQERRG